MGSKIILDDLDPEEKLKQELKAAFESDGTDDEDEVLDTESESDDSDVESGEESELGGEDDAAGEDQEDADDSDEVQVVKKRPSSKEQEKIIALKRELREAKEKLKAADANKKAANDLQLMESLVAKYTDAGYDEDTAKRNAKQDLDMQDLKHQLAISNFEARNTELFAIYPEARDNASEIIHKMEVTGFSAKQVCRALYAEETNPVKERAKKAVSGTLQTEKSNTSVSNATRAASPASGTTLTSEQRNEKRRLERHFPSLAGMTDSDYLESTK